MNIRQSIRSLLLLPLILAASLTACEPAPPTPSAEGERATVAEVVDGDTVELADGRRVRYIGVNTPETGRPYAQEAHRFNESLTLGQTVWLERDEMESDVYGRLLAYVWVGETFVNLELVRQGYANAFYVPPNGRYAALFAQAEEEARAAGLGMWAPADVPLRITALHYDGPGSDRVDPNGEWVELTNEGDEPLNLRGYTLKNAGLLLYTFGDITLPPGGTLRLYSGRGKDSATELYWGLAGEEAWHNTGDGAYLRTPDGLFVDCYVYSGD